MSFTLKAQHYKEIALYILPWFKNELQRSLRRHLPRKDVIDSMESTICNMEGGRYEIAVTYKEFFAAQKTMSFQEMYNKGYWKLKKTPVPEKCCEVVSTLYTAIAEVYKDNWYCDLDLRESHCITEWVELKKDEFKKAFWRVLKAEQRQNKRSQTLRKRKDVCSNSGR